MFKGMFRFLFSRSVLLEAGAAIVFFGSLIQSQSLNEHAEKALRDLQSRGYSVPDASTPVRVYPAVTASSFSSSHAGGWRPGVISLRADPMGGLGPEVYLRHELMHEASFRTCSGKLPLWAEEAAAMSFSGELSQSPGQSSLVVADLDRLKRRIRDGAAFDQTNYRALAALVVAHGWPREPCALSGKIEEVLTDGVASSKDAAFSYLLMHLISGRVLDSKGDLKVKYPPGSLMKIPFAAALEQASAGEIGRDLARSDASALLKLKGYFNPDHYRLLISMVKDAGLGHPVSLEELSERDEKYWRRYLGERDPKDGSFPLEAGLMELAYMLRASLLFQPEYFTGLRSNGFMEGSTLYREAESYKGILSTLHAMSKTGTVSDERGQPLVGHLMVAWPVERPLFLALFRSVGANGASNLRNASEVLRKWALRFSHELGKVRVRLMSLTPRDSWQIVDECPAFEKKDHKGVGKKVSTCGRFSILSSARGSRSERSVSGILEFSLDGEKVVLETDPETYADAVLSSEAQEISGEAEKALRAVIVWNGAHGRGRHTETSSLCDSTHCMVFRGFPPESSEKRSLTDAALLKLLDKLAEDNRLEWLPFAKGGNEKWERFIAAEELEKTVSEPSILELRRERTRSGDVLVHLYYPENEDIVPCEYFRGKLKLPSCPESIVEDERRSGWLFRGMGAGHGLGLSVDRAKELARSGSDAASILRDAFQ